MFDLSLGKLLVIGVLALFLVGPEKLPLYAAKLAQWVRLARGMVDGAKDRMREELGPDFDDVDWQRLDPRQYHPRRIVREALFDAPPPSTEPRAARAVRSFDELEDAPEAVAEPVAARQR